MKSFANDDYTPSLSRGQQSRRVSVVSCPKHVDISVTVPWEEAPAFQHVFGAITGQLDKAIGVHDRDESDRQVTQQRTARETALRRRQFGRIGRLAARALRRELANGRDRRSILNELSGLHGAPASQVEFLIRHHERRVKPRYERLVDRYFIRMVAAGVSSQEIAKALGWSMSKTTKRRALVSRQMREASNDN